MWTSHHWQSRAWIRPACVVAACSFALVLLLGSVVRSLEARGPSLLVRQPFRSNPGPGAEDVAIAPATRELPGGVIAILFPQFHRFALNDRLWGDGFTDWWGVSKTAATNFADSKFPVITPVAGYYDQSLFDTRRRQAREALAHGISGFMIYHYWFGNNVTMDAPLENSLLDDGWDIPFFFSWANENWTRNWDGGDREVLVAQDYSAASWEAHFFWLLRFFKSPHYMTREGAPMFTIYRAHVGIPGFLSMLRRWKDLAVQHGLPPPGIWFIETLTPDFSDPLAQNVNLGWVRREIFKSEFEFVAYGSVDGMSFQHDHFPGVSAGWNTRPRHANDGNDMYWQQHPVTFKRELRLALSRAPPKGFVFVNAWNEWGEGAALEPSNEWGHAFLQAVRSAVDEHRAGLPLFVVPPAGALTAPSEASTIGSAPKVCISIPPDNRHSTTDALARTLASLRGLRYSNWRAAVYVCPEIHDTVGSLFPELADSHFSLLVADGKLEGSEGRGG